MKKKIFIGLICLLLLGCSFEFPDDIFPEFPLEIDSEYTIVLGEFMEWGFNRLYYTGEVNIGVFSMTYSLEKKNLLVYFDKNQPTFIFQYFEMVRYSGLSRERIRFYYSVVVEIVAVDSTKIIIKIIEANRGV